MGQLATGARDNKNFLQTTSGTVASIGLEQTGQRVAGALITPATWALNYAADGSKPNAVDYGIYLTGFVSAPASIMTGLVKAASDDDIGRKLDLVRSKEPSKPAQFIAPCGSYGYAPPQTNAMAIASKGGTAWITTVGLWVYITDAAGRLLADYTPKAYVQMYRPQKPYKANKQGRFVWEVIRKK